MAMMISWVMPVNSSHPYLENDPAPSFAPTICAFHLGFSLGCRPRWRLMGDSVLPPHHPAMPQCGQGLRTVRRHSIPPGCGSPADSAGSDPSMHCRQPGLRPPDPSTVCNHSGGIVHGVIGDSGLLGACLPQSGDTDLPWRVPGPLMDHGGSPVSCLQRTAPTPDAERGIRFC